MIPAFSERYAAVLTLNLEEMRNVDECTSRRAVARTEREQCNYLKYLVEDFAPEI